MLSLGEQERDQMTDQTPGHRRLMPATRVRKEIFGGVSPMSEWRWLKTYESMPRPIRIGSQNFYDVAEIEAWLASFERIVPTPMKGATEADTDTEAA